MTPHEELFGTFQDHAAPVPVIHEPFLVALAGGRLAVGTLVEGS